MIHCLYFMASASMISMSAAFPFGRSHTADQDRIPDGSICHRLKIDLPASEEFVTGKCRFVRTVSPFDAKEQYVSNNGAHAFVAPSSKDQRGPCPGLNAMANHGYLPRDGIVSIHDLVQGTADAFGMGADLSSLLAVYGTVFGGDLKSYSMGRPYSELINQGGLATVLTNRHEGDVFPIQSNAHDPDDSASFDKSYVSRFATIYELGQSNNDSIDLALLTSYRRQPSQKSVEMKPRISGLPSRGYVDALATWPFVYRLMANKTAQHPEGHLSGEMLKSFYSISGDYPDFEYTPGHERFPDNWYKRNEADSYTIQHYVTDAKEMAVGNPGFLMDSADLEALTDGVFNSKNILEGNNLFCFVAQANLEAAPYFLSMLYGDPAPAIELLDDAIANATKAMDCPSMGKLNLDHL